MTESWHLDALTARIEELEKDNARLREKLGNVIKGMDEFSEGTKKRMAMANFRLDVLQEWSKTTQEIVAKHDYYVEQYREQRESDERRLNGIYVSYLRLLDHHEELEAWIRELVKASGEVLTVVRNRVADPPGCGTHCIYDDILDVLNVFEAKFPNDDKHAG